MLMFKQLIALNKLSTKTNPFHFYLYFEDDLLRLFSFLLSYPLRSGTYHLIKNIFAEWALHHKYHAVGSEETKYTFSIKCGKVM